MFIHKIGEVSLFDAEDPAVDVVLIIESCWSHRVCLKSPESSKSSLCVKQIRPPKLSEFSALIAYHCQLKTDRGLSMSRPNGTAVLITHARIAVGDASKQSLLGPPLMSIKSGYLL